MSPLINADACKVPLIMYLIILLTALRYLCPSGLESVYIVHQSKCKALLKTPSPRRAAPPVDTVFHNNNQKGKVSLILKLSHSAAPSSLCTSQRLMRTVFPQPYTFSYGWYSVVTLLCYWAAQDARQVQAVCFCTARPILSNLSVRVVFVLWGSVGGTSSLSFSVSVTIKIQLKGTVWILSRVVWGTYQSIFRIFPWLYLGARQPFPTVYWTESELIDLL